MKFKSIKQKYAKIRHKKDFVEMLFVTVLISLRLNILRLYKISVAFYHTSALSQSFHDIYFMPLISQVRSPR